MYRLLLALLCLLGLVQTVPAMQAQARIIGGQDVTQIRPWMVEVEHSRSGNPDHTSTRCGGALIAPHWVLTAAHCVVINGNTLEADTLFASLGHLDRHAEAPEQLAVAEVQVHPNYQVSSLHHDLALLRLQEPASATPLNLAAARQMQALAQDDNVDALSVLGWGETADGRLADHLQEATLQYISAEDCARHWNNLTDQQLCAGELQPQQDYSKDTCRGDSGGPLVYRDNGQDWLIGVVSYGHKDCGAPGMPAVYSRVASYLPWLEGTSGLVLASLQLHASLDRHYLFPGESSTLTVQVSNRSVHSGVRDAGVRIAHRSGIVVSGEGLQCEAEPGGSLCWRPGSRLPQGYTSSSMVLHLQHQGGQRWHDTLRLSPYARQHNYQHLDTPLPLTFSDEPNLAVTLESEQQGSQVSLKVRVANLADHVAASRVQLQLQLPRGWQAEDINGCTGSAVVSCALGDLTAEQEITRVFQLKGEGSGSVQARVSAENGDYPSHQSLARTAPEQARTVVSSGGSDSGGAFVMWLLAILLWQRRNPVSVD